MICKQLHHPVLQISYYLANISGILVNHLTKEILEYISEDNPDAVLTLIDQFETKVEKLKLNSESGRVLPEVKNDKIREIVVHKNYGIIYAIYPDTIKILTVRHLRLKFSAFKL